MSNFLIRLIILSFVAIIVILSITWFIPTDQIGFSQLVATCIGSVITIIAVSLAVYEFEVSQRRPDLNLYFQEKNGVLVKTLGIHRPELSRYFNIALVLKNKSKAAAEFVKIEVDFQRGNHIETKNNQEMRVFEKHQYSSFWNTNISGQTRLQALFSGGRDFILYSDDAEIVGRFEIYVLDEGQKIDEISVHCRIRAQGMNKKDEQLTIFIRDRHL